MKKLTTWNYIQLFFVVSFILFSYFSDRLELKLMMATVAISFALGVLKERINKKIFYVLAVGNTVIAAGILIYMIL